MPLQSGHEEQFVAGYTSSGLDIQLLPNHLNSPPTCWCVNTHTYLSRSDPSLWSHYRKHLQDRECSPPVCAPAPCSWQSVALRRQRRMPADPSPAPWNAGRADWPCSFQWRRHRSLWSCVRGCGLPAIASLGPRRCTRQSLRRSFRSAAYLRLCNPGARFHIYTEYLCMRSENLSAFTCILCRPSLCLPGGSAAWSACLQSTARGSDRAGSAWQCGGCTRRREGGKGWWGSLCTALHPTYSEGWWADSLKQRRLVSVNGILNKNMIQWYHSSQFGSQFGFRSKFSSLKIHCSQVHRIVWKVSDVVICTLSTEMCLRATLGTLLFSVLHW